MNVHATPQSLDGTEGTWSDGALSTVRSVGRSVSSLVSVFLTTTATNRVVVAVLSIALFRRALGLWLSMLLLVLLPLLLLLLFLLSLFLSCVCSAGRRRKQGLAVIVTVSSSESGSHCPNSRTDRQKVTRD